MFESIAIRSFFLSAIFIVSLVTCKYFHTPKIFLLIVILMTIFYQTDTNKKYNRTYNFEDTLINISKFIVISGILGYLTVTIVGLFLPGFN
jgi:hypothetical protein